ncbi:uncharacterized protein B0H18DRAFT_999289 [Fomitopsis serialis]|uniref:uncharacterized protein n=1 Tax=Fomitopsis serialis TaxID=139415 RepID=UPI002008DE1E|nr:uncharacterized protein B0H18DRAFT_999289 [Neoantrodia serialis]KAH9928901.1 hypothetical protein B0H18DRAFT_999289 [Neoantrodia serialis]
MYRAAYGKENEVNARLGREMRVVRGLDDFLVLPLAYQPYAPANPGAPGLCLGVGPAENRWPSVKRVFVEQPGGECLYVGEYRMHASLLGISFAEWMKAPEEWKMAWCQAVVKEAWGAPPVVHDWVRCYLGEVLEDECQLDILAENRDYYQQTLEDIQWRDVYQTYNWGGCGWDCHDIGVWRMECIDYDVEFQRSLVEHANVKKEENT